jgi:hypothetical protein
MAATVRLRIFSGRRNPSWSLTKAQTRELVTRLNISRRRGGESVQLFRMGGLGYHGFEVDPGPDPQSLEFEYPFTAYGGTVDFWDKEASTADIDRELERWLLESNSGLESAVLVQAKKEFETIYPDPKCRRRKSTKKTLAGRPLYRPKRWNDASAVQAANNCYSYANDLRHFRTGDHATPGESAKAPVDIGNCAEFRQAALADKLKQITRLPANGAPLALFIKRNKLDYHWYRQDRSGLWSHKPGGFPVRSCDESGNPISRPRAADVGDYVVFCGYFQTSRAAKDIIS